MKSTGVVRKVDDLGRIVVPIELRRTLDVAVRDPLEIFVDDETIILKKYSPDNKCMVTGDVSKKNINLYDGKITVSKEGAEQLMNDLNHYLQS